MTIVKEINDPARVEHAERDFLSTSKKYQKLVQLLRRPLFLWFFVIPNLAAAIFFTSIASPIFASRASLLVVNSSAGATLNALISGGSGDSLSGAYLFQDYASSWEAFQKLDHALDLARNFREGDLVSGYGKLATGFQANDVALWKYYARHVEVKVDDKSGIVSISVLGYRPSFAQALLQTLLQNAERHFERMTAAQRKKALEISADRAVALELALLRDEAALAGYRTRIGSYDLKENYLSLLSLLNSLSTRKSELASQYASIHAATPNSPDARNISSALSSLNARIAVLQRRTSVLERASAGYDALVRHRENDAAMLQQVNLAIQDARLKTARDRYYFDIVSSPSAPLTPEYPRRLAWLGGILLVSLVFWGLLR